MALQNLRELQQRADELSPSEQLALANYLLERARAASEPNGKDLMKFFGRVDFKGDPLAIQNKMRSEWKD